MRRPLVDLRQISERLDVVEALGMDKSTTDTLHDDILRRIPDISTLTRKLIHKKAGLQVCTILYFFHSPLLNVLFCFFFF